MNSGGQLAHHGAQETAGTKDKLRPVILLRPDHTGGNGSSPSLKFSEPVIDDMTKEPTGWAGQIPRLEKRHSLFICWALAQLSPMTPELGLFGADLGKAIKDLVSNPANHLAKVRPILEAFIS
jgi:hypothetical protein